MNTSFKQELKAKAHHLKPVVIIGSKGLTEAVIEETDISLKAHELIKVKINGVEKEDRITISEMLCGKINAEIIQLIGNTLVLYRKNEDYA